jgi:Aerotolerance regulator N-terminal/von Willebrand factor type A domain
MTFLHPSQLNWLWLAVIPIVLWLFRRKAKRVPVSTLLFFRTLAREHQESAWLRRMKKWASLLLTLFVILLVVFALASPFNRGDSGALTSVVILLDRSASMGAVDEKGTTRLASAKSLLKERIRALPERLIVSLVLFDSRVEVAQSRSRNHRELIRLIDQCQIAPLEGRPDEALAMGRRLADLDSPSEIWLVSDREIPETPAGLAQTKKPEPQLRFMSVALEHPLNAGITAFQIRPAPLSRNRYEAFVEVLAGKENARAMEATLEARLDGRPIQLRQLELKPGQSSRLVLPLEGGRGQLLEIELRADGDRLAVDNAVIAPLPEATPLVVAWLAEAPDPFTELALTSMLAEERIQVLKGSAKDWPLKEKPDVYVFENWVPAQWPTDRPALVLNPPGNAGPIHAKRLDKSLPYDGLRAIQPDHPVLFRVTSSRVALTQTTRLDPSDALEPLWMAGPEPLLTAGEANGQRIVVTAFVPSKSEQLALMSAFPLLIGNAIYWCAAGNESVNQSKVHRTGEIIPSTPGLAKWRSWNGKQFADLSEESSTEWLELRRVGIVTGRDSKEESALLLSAQVTDLPMKNEKPGDGGLSSPNWSGLGSWWTMLLWTALTVLMLESWLFHRHAVY